MPNSLASATSPYLQQHADNPVDWVEWGDAAFADATARGVPVLVSVGYAACHWCHVMAHESFEDAGTAAFMNEHFVCVKVDREERPDVDAVYMAATQAMTGAGGWPMTVFTTPTGEPFFCGTYFPPRPVQGMPSFPQVLASVAAAWTTRRDEVETSAATIAAALAERGTTPDPSGDHDAVAGRALAALGTAFDAGRGGFGRAPKFPPSMVLEWLLRHHARTGDAAALAMADTTLEAMARGGMYDQLAGGFARYSVDAAWTVPHFEKMLYDNAQLLRVYAHAFRADGSDLAHRVATETAGWMLDELRTAQGAFASSLDADSEGREGAFYAWSPAQLRDVLGDDDGAWAAEVLGVTEEGTFEHGTSVLQRRSDPADTERLDRLRARLLGDRERRPRPGRDDKVVSGWNGLAVAGLAEAGALLDRPDLVDAAAAAARFLLDTHVRRAHDGSVRLVRASRDGVPGAAPAVLEDYAHVADGLLALSAVTGDPAWFAAAGDLLETVLLHFAAQDGGLRDTADDETDAIIGRIRVLQDAADGPTPSGQSAAAAALLAYASLTGSLRHREAAERALRGPLQLAARFPTAAGAALAVVEAILDGPREVAVVGRRDDPATHALHRVALRSTAPGLVVALGEPGAESPPLLRDRPLVGGAPAAYVCRGFVCELPTTSPQDLATSLACGADTAPPALPPDPVSGNRPPSETP
ncbi:thioredoxin domain-containing protein [Cellulomonas fengjieae]|uniref:Thioredoxin domain-containing protein n=1 Tax=Cellulomonas fengjieae TaxID=2819978 RepID=A0ABS3SDC4_9CELL|nr:thioredoxin domain-containing protein [Cellulomonas fengjieae]MBO3083748.1 thioredoxin domain-containing protein [Cellulomonas fengjieae]QVI64954.1 thioredoxin domain-containing protein [Cellulomonas fengjieae]